MSESAEVIIKAPPTPELKPEPAKAYEGPDYIPEKFRSAEDPAKAMAEAYAALEKKQGETPKPEEKKAEPTAEEKAAAEAAAAAAGDFDKFFSEFDKEGKLSDESYKALEAKGLKRDIVDSYISGLQTQADAAGRELKGSVGGDATYDAAMAWGATNLTEAEQTAYNEVLKRGDMAAAKTMAGAFVAKYKAATGEDPGRTITGDRTDNTRDAYSSRDEMLRDQMKPEYRSDPAFRAMVERKAMNSTAF